MRTARVLAAVGRAMMTAGVLVLLFVAYLLWGTSLSAARAQDRLEDDFEAQLAEVDAPVVSPTTTTTTRPPSSTTSTTTTSVPAPTTTEPVPAPADLERPPEGEAVGRIEIAAIGVDWIFVEGVGLHDLKKGPGHYPDTPFPGQAGNAAIAGHRTTYGAPFHRVNELAAGDVIVVTTLQGEFVYTVTEQLVVDPDQVEVLDDFGDNRLTLTACHPKYSARKRIVIVAELGSEALPPSPPSDTGLEPADDSGEIGSASSASSPNLSGESAANLPAIVWGLVCAAIWLGAWLIGRRGHKWLVYLLGLPIFLVALFFFFENFSRLLPANF